MQDFSLLLAVRDSSIIQALLENNFFVATAESLEKVWDPGSRYGAAIVELTSDNTERFWAIYRDLSRPALPIIAVVDGEDALVMQLLQYRIFGIIAGFEVSKLKRILEAVQELREEDRLDVVSATPSWVEVNIPAHPAYIARLSSFFEPVASRLFKSDSTKVLMAFRELLQNAIEHGSSFSLEKKVVIRYVKSQNFVMFQIEDDGPGFDRNLLPHAAIRSDKNALREAMRYRRQSGMRPGGFGICYVSGAVDDLIYNQKGNAVTMIKYFGESHGEEGDREMINRFQ